MDSLKASTNKCVKGASLAILIGPNIGRPSAYALIKPRTRFHSQEHFNSIYLPNQCMTIVVTLGITELFKIIDFLVNCRKFERPALP